MRHLQYILNSQPLFWTDQRSTTLLHNSEFSHFVCFGEYFLKHFKVVTLRCWFWNHLQINLDGRRNGKKPVYLPPSVQHMHCAVLGQGRKPLQYQLKKNIYNVTCWGYFIKLQLPFSSSAVPIRFCGVASILVLHQKSLVLFQCFFQEIIHV